MNTRATYTIIDRKYSSEVSQDFYIHHDGYPAGASTYFEAFINHDNNRGTAIEKFLRANSNAEFTDKASNHSDREYHYEFDNVTQKLKAYNCAFDDEIKEPFFNGKLADFLNEHLEPQNTVFGKTKKEFIHYSVAHAFGLETTHSTIDKKVLANELNEVVARALDWLSSGHIGNVSTEKIKNMNQHIQDTQVNKQIAYIESSLQHIKEKRMIQHISKN